MFGKVFVVFQEYLVVFQELFVVFADMGHRTLECSPNFPPAQYLDIRTRTLNYFFITLSKAHKNSRYSLLTSSARSMGI